MINARSFIALSLIASLNVLYAGNNNGNVASTMQKVLRYQHPFHHSEALIREKSQTMADMYVRMAIEGPASYSSRPYNEYIAWCEGSIGAQNALQEITNVNANTMLLVGVAALALPRTRSALAVFLGAGFALKGQAVVDSPHVDSRLVIEELRHKEQHVRWMRLQRSLAIKPEKN